MAERIWTILTALAGVLLVFGAEATASAGELEGTLVDSLTGKPIPGATVRVLGTNRVATTDAEGDWSFDLPNGEYELAFEKTLGDRHHRFRLVNQHVPQYKPADSHLPTTYFMDRGVPRLDRPVGAPTPRIPDPSSADDTPQKLGDLFDQSKTFHPGDLTVPKNPPVKIRVGRRQDHTTCRNSPIVAIEEMTLTEYVRGVLPPEIGVFRNLNNVSEVYKAFGVAAKSYALWFMIRYDSGNRRTVSSPKPPNNYQWFHIDDTACNQRYSDMRYSITTKAADAMSGKLLVKKGAPDTLDKYEYAASCAEHGSRPEYQTKIVPDESPKRSCVGSWCGHDDCAGHADHPDVPGSDRCLVRGICQWGSAEWAEGGKSHTWLLSHYQPNLELRNVGGTTMPETVALTGYAYTDPSDIAKTGVSGASISLSDGQTTTTDADGKFTFDEVEVSLGTVTVTANKAGYAQNMRQKMLTSGQTNWASIQLTPEQTGGDTGTSMPDTGTPPADTGMMADDTGTPDPMSDTSSQMPTPDTNVTGADTAAEGTDYGPKGGLGSSLLSRSEGTSSGCSAARDNKKPAGGALAFIAVCATWLLRRRVVG